MSGFVYAIEADNGLVKIGFTRELLARLSHLRANNCLALTPLGYARGTIDQEAELHGLLGAECVRGEWFRRGRLTNHFLSMLKPWPTPVERLQRPDIRGAREMLGESQTVFAKRFDVNQATIARWEEDGPPTSGPGGILVEALLSHLFKAPPQAEAIAP